MKQKLLLSAALLATMAAHAQTNNVGIGTTTPTDQLHTTGTVRFQNYRGPGTRAVQIDSSGRLVVTGDGPTFSNNSLGAIPDNGCAGGTALTRSITVSGLPTSVPTSKIAVRVRITHPSVAHLRIYLEGPSSIRLCLAAPSFGGANMTNTIFTDEAVNSINSAFIGNAPFTAKYKPDGNNTVLCGSYQGTVTSFSAMLGGSINPNATWTLRVYDAFSPISGTLDGWDISFSGPESFTTTDQDKFVARFDGGSFSASSMYQDGPNVGVRTTTPQAALHVSDAGGDSLLLLENPTPLFTGRNAFLDFRTGTTYTGRIGTNGIDAQTASLGFYTSAGTSPTSLQKRMTILDGGHVGIGIADASVSERLHVDGGNMKLGLAQWNGTAANRLLKFGDGDFVSIGEAGADDRMELTASAIVLKRLTGNTSVGINNSLPSYNLDVTGDFRTTSNATIGGVLSVPNTSILGSVQITSGTPAVGDVLTATNTAGTATWQTPAGPTWTRFVNVLLPTYSPASIGIAIQSGLVTERLHVDTGNIKLGRNQWSTSANDRFIKFGDGDFVTIGETTADDRMMLTAKHHIFRTAPGVNPGLRVVGGEVRLYDVSSADSTIVMRGTRSAGQSGEMYFVDPGTNERTITIDGDYNNSNRSRIIVDEVQITGGSDFAEMFDVAAAGDVSPEAGMLVSIDEAQPGALIVSASSYDTKVAGVISGAGGVKPGMMMGQKGTGANGGQPVAITGRVYVKADARGGAIHPGDLLTTSSLPGHAMKATDRKKRDGAVIGKAMTPLAKGSTGEVLVLLGIQ